MDVLSLGTVEVTGLISFISLTLFHERSAMFKSFWYSSLHVPRAQNLKL